MYRYFAKSAKLRVYGRKGMSMLNCENFSSHRFLRVGINVVLSLVTHWDGQWLGEASGIGWVATRGVCGRMNCRRFFSDPFPIKINKTNKSRMVWKLYSFSFSSDGVKCPPTPRNLAVGCRQPCIIQQFDSTKSYLYHRFRLQVYGAIRGGGEEGTR